MDHELTQIFRLLSRAFSYPDQGNSSPAFFSAIKELAVTAGLENKRLSYSLQELRDAYTRLFINRADGPIVPPYASVYVSGHGLLAQEGLEQAMDFYHRAGLEPSGLDEPADFLPVELYFASVLAEQGNLRLLSEFVREHLLAWFPRFQQKLQAAGSHPYYSLLSRLILFYLTILNKEVFDEAT